MAISACPQAGSDGRQPPGAGAAFANAATAMAARMTLTAKRIANKERMETGKVGERKLLRTAIGCGVMGTLTVGLYPAGKRFANVVASHHTNRSRSSIVRGSSGLDAEWTAGYRMVHSAQ